MGSERGLGERQRGDRRGGKAEIGGSAGGRVASQDGEGAEARDGGRGARQERRKGLRRKKNHLGDIEMG